MSCLQKSIIASVSTALVVGAAFFAIYAVTQADEIQCEDGTGTQELHEEDDDAKPEIKTRQRRRGI